MAKVKIQGHASGTGVLTVTAPNTSTDRTITLPDADVTLGAATPSIDDNGNATAITIDSDENVGFGVTPETDWYPKVIQSGNRGAVYGYSNQTHLSNNAKMIDVSENYKYMESSYATDYSQEGGTHQFKVAPSGSADAAITWTTAMTIDNNGIITKPVQPAFSAKLSTTTNNLAVSGTPPTILFNTEIFDNNSDFNTGTYTFTAPVTGRYNLSSNLYLVNLDTAAGYVQMELITSNRQYYYITTPNAYDLDMLYRTQNISVLADMDASDTAYVRLRITGGTAQTDVDPGSYFSAHLVC